MDLAVALERSRIEDAIRAAEANGLRRDPSRPLVPLGSTLVARLLHHDEETGLEIRVDWLLAESGFLAEAVRRATPRRILGMHLPLASCEDLILLKLAAGRPLDRVDAEELVTANRGRLDLSRLREWAGRLGLSEELDRCLSPGAG